jgi:hypothetical protein
MSSRCSIAVALTIAAALPALAVDGAAAPDPGFSTDAPRNWFDDPFFQVAHAIPQCPTPAGPLLTEAERRVQAHHRAERGTSCWLGGQCDKASAYAHDAEIAHDLRARWAASARFDAASLWVTVQHGIVFVEGCVAPSISAADIEAFVRATPHVQQAVAIVHSDLKTRPAYKVLAPR